MRSFLTCTGVVAVPVLDTSTGEEMEIDRDVDIFKFMWPELVGSYADSSPVAFPPGFTRMVLDQKVQTTDLVERCLESFKRLVDTSDCALCVFRCCRCAHVEGSVVEKGGGVMSAPGAGGAPRREADLILSDLTLIVSLPCFCQ